MKPRKSRWLPQEARRARYPARAAWLQARLDERGWDKHDLAHFGGPNHRTTEKVLAGLAVPEDVLPKIAEGLSASGAKVNLTEIPSQ